MICSWKSVRSYTLFSFWFLMGYQSTSWENFVSVFHLFSTAGLGFRNKFGRNQKPALCKLDQTFCCFLLQIVSYCGCWTAICVTLACVLDCFGRFGNCVYVFSTPNQFWQQPATLSCCNSFYTCIERTNCLGMYLACFSEIHINFASKDGPSISFGQIYSRWQNNPQTTWFVCWGNVYMRQFSGKTQILESWIILDLPPTTP